MPTEVTAFKAKDGSLHEDACTAAFRDVELLVKASPLNENGPFAKQAIAWLAENAAEIIGTLTELTARCPKDLKIEGAPESGEGPVVADLDAEEIPPLVYWDGEHNNFYGATSRRGQGQAFFDKWYPRRAEFPQSYGEIENAE